MKAQVSIEYMIVLGFVTFAVMSTLLIASYYSGFVQDKIKLNQVELMASKIINSAESVFYSGAPSQATVIVYIPQGVESIELSNKDIIITTETSSGIVKQAFSSNVVLEGSIPTNWGTKNIVLKAETNKVTIN